MEGPHKEYSENDSTETNKMAAEYGNQPANQKSDNSGNDTFGDSDTTTGSGYSERERSVQDGSTTRNADEPDRGSRDLIDKYNINDQAHSDSSKEDFVKTVSNFGHANDKETDDELPNQSRH